MAFQMTDWEAGHIVPVLGFAILAAALLLFFFLAVPPRRGTTEWMSRIGRKSPTALRCGRLRLTDLLWFALTALGGAGISLLAGGQLGWQTLLYAACAGEFYLSLRLFCADALTSALFAALLPAMLPETPLPAALMVTSLLALLLWLGRDPAEGLFPWALLLPAFTLLFGAAVLLEHRLFWLAPVYPAAYLFAQVQRWRAGDEERGGRFLISLVLTPLTAALCAAGLYLVRLWLAGEALTDAKTLLSGFCAAFVRLLHELRPEERTVRLQWRECYLLLYAAASLPPAFYGLFVRRELCCLAMLLLPLPFAALWLLGGYPAMALALLPLPAWALSTLGKRWRAAEILSAAAMPLFYLMELWLP